MAHGVLREFDPLKKSIEDFHKRFYCLANNIQIEGEGDIQQKQVLFLNYPFQPGCFCQVEDINKFSSC